MAPTFFTPTPDYDGAGSPTATASAACPDPVGWLLGWLAVQTPAYEGPVVGAGAGGGLTDTGSIARDPATPIVLAPSGPVTIVLGADVRFASE